MDKVAKNYRILALYLKLCEGKSISKAEEAQRYHVDERSIQRDIDDIRAFLTERNALDNTECRTIEYDRAQKRFIMRGSESGMLSNSEILAVSKILLESRAFTKKEIGEILDKLISGCVPQKNLKLVTDLVANEKYHYVELHHKSSVKECLWDLGCNIKDHQLLEITYGKQIPKKKTVKRMIEPVAILFSEYYFYLNAFIVDRGENGYKHRFDYPAIFRIDRIIDYRKLGEQFHVDYADRFQEGEYRKRVQFMFAGELMRVRFRYEGDSVDAILDRLPTAQILTEENRTYIIEAEVYGKGILMWLLSQGDAVEILKPQSLRDEMEQMLENMLRKYQ